MASFKSLKNSFNRVYVNGVLSIYKKINLKSHRFFWSLLGGLIPTKKTNNNQCLATPATGSLLNKRIHYFVDSTHYVWTGYTWVRFSTLPKSINPGTGTMRRGFVTNNIYQLYYISCVATASNTSTVYISYERNGTFTWEQWSTLPYNAYNCVAIYYGGIMHVFGGGSNEYHLKHYYTGVSSNIWMEAENLPKDFFKTSTTGNSYSAAILIHKDKVHLFGYSSTDNLIYDCFFENGLLKTPTLKVIATGHGYDMWPYGAFEDATGIMYMYTQSKMYRYDDNLDTWTVIESNYIGYYTINCMALLHNKTLTDGVVYRLNNQNRYELSVAYKLEYGDMTT